MPHFAVHYALFDQHTKQCVKVSSDTVEASDPEAARNQIRRANRKHIVNIRKVKVHAAG